MNSKKGAKTRGNCGQIRGTPSLIMPSNIPAMQDEKLELQKWHHRMPRDSSVECRIACKLARSNRRSAHGLSWCRAHTALLHMACRDTRNRVVRFCWVLRRLPRPQKKYSNKVEPKRTWWSSLRPKQLLHSGQCNYTASIKRCLLRDDI